MGHGNLVGVKRSHHNRYAAVLLAAFLRAPGRDARNVPPRFLASLRRALARYGVRDLDHTEPLEEALYHMENHYIDVMTSEAA